LEVVLPQEGKISGAILSDRIKSLDWRAGKAKSLSKASREVIAGVLAKIHTLTEYDEM